MSTYLSFPVQHIQVPTNNPFHKHKILFLSNPKVYSLQTEIRNINYITNNHPILNQESDPNTLILLLQPENNHKTLQIGCERNHHCTTPFTMLKGTKETIPIIIHLAPKLKTSQIDLLSKDSILF